MRKIVKSNKRHKEKNIVKKQTGITLIALVITIIVLLILAGVSIAMLTGNNGILTQANQAKENTKIATAKEKVQIEAAGSLDNTGVFSKAKFKENLKENLKLTDSDIVDNADGTMTVKIDGYDVTVDGTTGRVTGIAIANGKVSSTGVTPGVEVSKTEKNNYSDGTDTATIPEGFTVDKKENTISKGLVVHGPDGSEFVWVPVPDINSMSQCSKTDGSCNLQLDGNTLKCKTHNNNEEIVGKLYATKWGENFGTVNTTYSADNEMREPAYLTNVDKGDASKFNTIGLKLLDMQKDYRSMAISVAKYGGFYVGRYETSLSDATPTSEGASGTAQSKQGVIPTSAESNATYRWYGLYSKQDKTYTGTNNSVESSMIWGSQYDAMLNWAKNGVDKEKITNASPGNNSSENVTTTGNSSYSEDSINNIRDLGGNLMEWTLEANDTLVRVVRGANYYRDFSPSFRYNNDPSCTFSSTGSRLTLYIK